MNFVEMTYLIISLFVLFSIYSNIVNSCPTKCYCQSTSVKCMLSHLQTVPSNLPENTTVLDLRFNDIKELSNDSFRNTPNLETLLLSNNQIRALRTGVLDNLHKLRHLYFHKNKIETIEPNTFRNLRSLEQLYLHYNNITHIREDIFQGLTNLERLFLYNNNLETLEAGTFDELTSVKHLRLDGNPLICDCQIFWLLNSYFENGGKTADVQISGICEEPASLYGKSLYDLRILSVFNECRYPQFTVQPEDEHVPYGGSRAEFNCKATGYPRPHISWKKDGLIDGVSVHSTELDTTTEKYKLTSNSLIINLPSPVDEGSYECIAANDVVTIRSHIAILKINRNEEKRKLSGSVNPTRTVSVEGGTVQIDCFTDEQTSTQVSWLRNNISLPKSTLKTQILENGTLIINNIELNDSGKYYCVPVGFDSVFGSSEVIVYAPPKIKSYLGSYSTVAGTSIKLECTSTGYPDPTFIWFKNGRTVVPNTRILFEQKDKSTLSVENLVESDSGMYTCLAQNVMGVDERNSELRVKNKGPRTPRIVTRPFDIEVPEFSSIEMPCKVDGEPKPRVQWLKNNRLIIDDKSKFRISPVSSLRIYNVSLGDSGQYECIASNVYGNDTARGTLTVIGDFQSENDIHIVQAYNEAKLEIDRAINATINNLFAQRHDKSPTFLMRFFRYPDEVSRNLARSADIYARTLNNVRKNIAAGLKLNLTDDFSYMDVLTTNQLELVANISGCVSHQPIVNCSDRTFHSKYSTLDGTCNNVDNPMWGSSYTAFRRIVKPIYENGFSTPVGWNKDVKYYGFAKPQARLVSTSIVRTYNITPDNEITHMVMQWGQFLDHDLDHALPSTTAESWEGLDCKKTCAYSEPCFPMEVPANDTRIRNRRCMDFIRSSAVCGSGVTSVFFDKLQPRQQLNQLTSYLDASQVYGFIRDRSFLLRDLTSDLGLLRGGITAYGDNLYLPTAGITEVDCRRDLVESDVGCFLAGDIRVNEQVGLIAMHTIWFREHNRLATRLREVNPHWDGDTLFFEARKIVIAEMQHITFSHWLPLILGNSMETLLGAYPGYDPTVDASISNVFATAALRFGHTIINPELRRLDHEYNVIPQGNLPLGKAFFAPWRLIEEGGVDPLMRGLFATPAKRKRPNQNLNDQLIDELFTAAHAVSLDLAAMNIQRSRDHGLPGYTEFRRFCNLSVPESFDNLEEEISDAEMRSKLRSLYGHPGNVDVWVGGILEDQKSNARIGPLFQCLLAEQFKRMRNGDRFWYENPSTFKPSQLAALKQTSLARVLCDNGDNMQEITRNVFIQPQQQTSKFVACSEVPGINLREWRDCGSGKC